MKKLCIVVVNSSIEQFYLLRRMQIGEITLFEDLHTNYEAHLSHLLHGMFLMEVHHSRVVDVFQAELSTFTLLNAQNMNSWRSSHTPILSP